MLKTYFQLTNFKPNGKITRKSRKKRSRSFVQQFLQICYADWADTSTSATDITNTSITVSGNAARDTLQVHHPGGLHSNMATYGGQQSSAADEVGIIIGTSTQAVAITDIALVTPINNGLAAGEMEYLFCALNNFTTNVGGGTASFDIVRVFRNSSGSDITINEIGLYTNSVSTSNSPHFCIVRDIISPGQSVANGEYLKATYTFTIST